MPSKKKKGQDKASRVEGYNDDKADFELVSADDVAFKVHSYYLMAARYAASVSHIGLARARTGTDTPASSFATC
jgi:hypothetical protein